MRELVLCALSLSLSGSLAALALLALRPFFRRHLSRTWHYYIWLLVLARLLLPLGPPHSPMQAAGEHMGAYMARSPVQTAGADAPAPAETGGGEAAGQQPAAPQPPAGDSPAPPGGAPAPLSAWDTACAVWLGVAGALLLKRIVSYTALLREIRRTAVPCEDAALLQLTASLCRQLRIPLQPPVYESPRVPTPLLAGMLRPRVILPAHSACSGDLRLILHHELVHFRRGDILYKWLAQAAVCVHWFNPLVRLAQREIARCCELACDEAVVRGLNRADRSRYGQAILAAVRPAGTQSYAAVSLSMSEDKRQLKERLTAIMDYHKKGGRALAAAAVITGALLLGTVLTGAYTPAAIRGPQASAPAAYGDLSAATILGDTWHLIDTEQQLRGLGDGTYPLDGRYLLNADIALNTSVDWIPVGTRETPFTGVFNGNGFEIAGLTITDPAVDVIGMFAHGENAHIYNVTLRRPDIQGAFTPGSSIGPVLVLGKNCRSHDNRILDPVERDPAGDSAAARPAGQSYSARTGSLIDNFAPYASLGVVYHPDSDTVTYNGQVVKLFAVFRPAENTTYSFDLLYRDKRADSTLYLEAVRDSAGAVQIRRIDPALVRELLRDLEEDAPAGAAAGEPEGGGFRPYNFDATFHWTNHGITATDKFDRDSLGADVKSWLDACAGRPGAHLLQTQSGGVYTTYLHYNGGGRYPWEMRMEDGVPAIHLYSDSPPATPDGDFLLYFTAPRDYGGARLYLDGVPLQFIS